mgnify:CR=1 FL=1
MKNKISELYVWWIEFKMNPVVFLVMYSVYMWIGLKLIFYPKNAGTADIVFSGIFICLLVFEEFLSSLIEYMDRNK